MKFPNLKTRLVLAPMAGVTDIAFRELCVKYGAALTITEMISAQALVRGNERTKLLLRRSKVERPFAIQLFGKDPEVMIKAAKLVEKKCDMIDVNLGCPASKIIRQGYGSSLLQDPKVVFDIVSTLVKNIKKPITVKIRSGIDSKHITAVEIAKAAEKAGAAAITVHARTQKQGYSGKADWNIIRKVKKAVSIPVIGNGDVMSGKKAEQMIKETGSDYIMVGRAARGKPELFKDIAEYLENKKETTHKRDLKAFKQYLLLAEKYNLSLSTIKKQAAQFTKGIKGGAELRRNISKCKSLLELKKVLC